MTERKPPEITFETWVDHQIRTAGERGEFDNLKGAGKPLAEVDAPYDELWWIRRKAHREGVSLLPPTLQLRKDAEDALPAALRARSEREARAIVEGINERITAILRCPPPGPILNVRPFDVEDVAAQWRAAHPGHAPRRSDADAAADTATDSAADAAAARRRRPRAWWRPRDRAR